ncbi:MAG: MFS transporter [Gammaproteobacteria bacterium]|nr:MFS transporter [Gammaproteobacteria bacterium]
MRAAFFLSCLLAFSAGHMVNYSVILYLQEAVGSDLLAGAGLGLCFGPPLLFGWFAGALCDRMAPVRLIHMAQAVFVAALVTLAWADAAVPVPAARVPWVLGAAGLAGIAWSFVAPARMAALAQLVPAAQLKAASVLFNLLVMLGFGLGPVLIGVLRQSGWPSVFAGAAACFVAASLLLLPISAGRAAAGSRRSVLGDIREGFAAVARQDLVRQLLLAGVMAYAMMGPLQILLPRLARSRLGLDELGQGLYLGLLALSLIVGGVACLALARRVHHGRTILWGTAAAGVAFAALGASSVLGLSAALLGLIGIAGGVVVSLIAAGIQANAPPAVRGRILSMFTISSQVVPAASGVLAGALLNALGLVPAIHLAGALLVAAAAIAALRLHALRAHRA